ncbi:MAG: hypothetical protein ACXABY_05420 [Candidatus Thorarchaeota archaeon]|jgi:hypothetical protein
MAIGIMEFYNPWPFLGRPFGKQLNENRTNTNSLSALIRAAETDLSPVSDRQHVLAYWDFGELNFRNRFRVGYDKSANEFLVQVNQGTQGTPSWNSVMRMLESNSRVIIEGVGGLQTTGGFYYTDTVNVSESEAGGFSKDSDSIVFNSDDFYVGVGGGGKPLVSQITPAAQRGTLTSITFAESESGGFSDVTSLGAATLKFDSDAGFYVSSGGDGEPLVSHDPVIKMAVVRKVRSAQSVAHATSVTVSYDEIVEDIGGWVNLSDSDNVFTVPSGVKRVIVRAQVEWDRTTGSQFVGNRIVNIQKNSAILPAQPANIRQVSDFSAGTPANQECLQQVASYPISVVQGDTFRVRVFNDAKDNTTAVNVGVDDATGDIRTWFSIEKVA